MKIISEFYSDDGTRKTIIFRTNERKEPFGVSVFFNGNELKDHYKQFKHLDVAEWYAEEWVQK